LDTIPLKPPWDTVIFSKKIKKMHMNRRVFVFNSLLGGVLSLAAKSSKLPLAFSTLGCPDWSWDQILTFAQKSGFSGIELRGIGPDLDILSSPVFSKSQRKGTLRQLNDAGIQLFNLGSSAHLHAHDPKVRAEQLDHAKRYLDLAMEMNCRFVRVFPDHFPVGYTREATLEQIKSGLTELSNHIHGSKTRVLLETHGEVVASPMLANIMQEVNRKEVGLIWDPFNMWIKTQEDVAAMYHNLKPWIRHVHLKDARVSATGFTYVLCGQGDFALDKVVQILQKDKYSGYYSLEWEKKWHPTIAPPEEAFPHFVSYMQRFT